MIATVYVFNIWYKNADGTLDLDFMQTRYVLANDEDEAEEKLNAHREQMVKDGFADFRYVYNGKETISNVIC